MRLFCNIYYGIAFFLIKITHKLCNLNKMESDLLANHKILHIFAKDIETNVKSDVSNH